MPASIRSKLDSHYKTGVNCLKRVLEKLEKIKNRENNSIPEDITLFFLSYLKMAESEFNSMWKIIQKSPSVSPFSTLQETDRTKPSTSSYINLKDYYWNSPSSNFEKSTNQRKKKNSKKKRKPFGELTDKTEELSSSFLSPKGGNRRSSGFGIEGKIPKFDLALERDSKFYKKSSRNEKNKKNSVIQNLNDFINSAQRASSQNTLTRNSNLSTQIASPKINISQHLKTKNLKKGESERLLSELNTIGKSRFLNELSNLSATRNMISRKMLKSSSPKIVKFSPNLCTSPQIGISCNKENINYLGNMSKKISPSNKNLKKKSRKYYIPSKSGKKKWRSNVIHLSKVLQQIGSKRKEDIIKRQKSIERLEEKLKEREKKFFNAVEDRDNVELSYSRGESKDSKYQSFYETELKKFMDCNLKKDGDKRGEEGMRRVRKSGKEKEEIFSFRKESGKNNKRSKSYNQSGGMSDKVNVRNLLSRAKSVKEEDFKGLLGRFGADGVLARSKSVSLQAGRKLQRIKEIMRLDNEISKIGGMIRYNVR